MTALVATARPYVLLRWRLLRGALRHGGTEQAGAVLTVLASAAIGIGLGATALSIGRGNDEADAFIVAFCGFLVLAVVAVGVVAGVAQPIDPRVIATEPITERQRTVGLLAATSFGPAGIAGMVMGLGVVGGMVRGVDTLPVVLLATLAWLASLLLVARTATNLLALLLARFPRWGQVVVGLSGLAFYGVAQLVPVLLGDPDRAGRQRLSDAIAWSPPGQLGRAMARADDAPATAWLHLAVGAAWVPLLVLGFGWSAQRLAVSVRRTGRLDGDVAERSPVARLVRSACGTGPSGAIAWRSILVRFRTPRTALEAVTGAGVGLAAVLVPTLTRDAAGSGAVLVGGAIQLAVLFMSGNSFGTDGPPITHELLAGAGPRELVEGKLRSVLVVAAPLAVIGPLAAASITGEWRYLAAGFGVGVGALFAGAGAAIVQSAVVPIAVPESDNPFVGGETGKGMLAALLLVVVLTALAVATVPVALALLWAVDRGDTVLVTVLGAITVAIGWLVARLGVRIATGRIAGDQPAFVAAVTPAR
jgi:hypothetical protein